MINIVRIRYYIFKVFITGIIVVIITEIAKFNLKLAALITAMPIVTLLCIFWMYYEGMEKKEISKERRCLQVNYVTFKTDWKVD